MVSTEELKDFARNPFAWPGFYTRVALTADGGIICHSCFRDNFRLILEDTTRKINQQWRVEHIAADMCNIELNGLQCSHCCETFCD